MTLTLSDDQYRRLLLLTMIGEWVVNATRKEPDAGYEAAASQMYSFAKETPAQTLVAYDNRDNAWTPSKEAEEDMHALIDDYDDKTFWEELTSRMAERDLIAERGERTAGGLHPSARVRAVQAHAKKYVDEFETHGLGRLFLSA